METTQRERFSYYGYSFGQIMIYMILTSFLQIYMTDIAIPAATVGTILLIARVLDAVYDPFFGIIVNKSKWKTGKYTPWLRISTFLIAGLTILLFAVPASLDLWVKILLAAGLYIIWGMCYTLCDVPYFSLVTVMTGSVTERNTILSRGRLFSLIGTAIIASLFPLAYPKTGWFWGVFIFTVLSFAVMTPLGRVAKERHPVTEEAPSLLALLKAVGRNKYLLVFCLAFMVANITNTILTVNGYFAIYCLGGPEMISITMTVPMLFAAVFCALVPAIIKKVDKFDLYMVATAVGVVSSIVMYLAGYSNFTLYMVLSTIRIVAVTYTSSFMILFVVDCAEYGRYKTGEDSTAVTVSLQTFTAKALGALSAALGMFILGLSGFVDGADAVQPPAVLDTLWILVSILPAAGLIVSFFILLFGYKLRDRDVQIMSKVNQKLLSREAAETMLSRKY
ncbi:MFS transporter [Paenibacillus physcomitrellae]|uniref:Glucuronide transporter n=1 Tax=Paenibacillus physcomitrellae TaxID=1619311 RepID=A0ABQ1GF76_9BACL|nr:glycoside-pentoside-hexuronide (GPH):cation symporter [Paenibacillus physcomitrellae]GGA42597.1 glucuronide transporter [Paenibacillus physcomitrellae]